MDRAPVILKPKLLVYTTEREDPEDGLSQECCKVLSQDFEIILPRSLANNPQIRHQIEGAVVRSPWQPMMTSLLRDMPNVKIVCATGVGVNHIDFDFCKSRGIMVGHNPDCVTQATADMAMGLLLATARSLPAGVLMTRHGNSRRLTGKDVTGATLGIVGLGRVGLQVARRARAFDMNVLYHGRNRKDDTGSHIMAEFCPTLGVMLPRCDFVVICCPLTSQTRHMFGETEFQLMKNDAVIVNVARGPVIDTNSLVEALRSNLIGGAGLDVTHPAKLPADHPLLRLDNVLVLPHWGASTHHTARRMARGLRANFRSVLLEGGRPVHEATPVT